MYKRQPSESETKLATKKWKITVGKCKLCNQVWCINDTWYTAKQIFNKMAIFKLACRLVSTWATWKDKTFEPEPVGWPVQAKRRRRSALFYEVDIMVTTVLSKKKKIKKQGLVAHC